MASNSWTTALAFVWRPENDGGGFHNDPGDTGGDTNKGVIQTTWATAIAHGYVPDIPLANATDDQLGTVLRVMFWNAVCGDGLAAGVDLAVFNLAMLAGPGRAAQILQSVVGATVDFSIGPKTLLAAKGIDASVLVNKFTDGEETFYAHCPTAPLFLRGWTRRAEDCRVASLKLRSQGFVS